MRHAPVNVLVALVGTIILGTACNQEPLSAPGDATTLILKNAAVSRAPSGQWTVSGTSEGVTVELAPQSVSTVESMSQALTVGTNVAYPPGGGGGPQCWTCVCIPTLCLSTIADPTPRCYDCYCTLGPCLAAAP